MQTVSSRKREVLYSTISKWQWRTDKGQRRNVTSQGKRSFFFFRMQRISRNNQYNKIKITTLLLQNYITFVYFPRNTKAKHIHKCAPGLQGFDRRKTWLYVSFLHIDIKLSPLVDWFMTWKSSKILKNGAKAVWTTELRKTNEIIE